MTRKVMKQALDALEIEQMAVTIERLVPKPHLTKAIDALRAAIAQPASPVQALDVTDADIKLAFPFVAGWNHSDDDMHRYRRALKAFAASKQASQTVIAPAIPGVRGPRPFVAPVAQPVPTFLTPEMREELNSRLSDHWFGCADEVWKIILSANTAVQPAAVGAVDLKRYKIGYSSDEWGMRSSTPGLIPDTDGSIIKYVDAIAAIAAIASKEVSR